MLVRTEATHASPEARRAPAVCVPPEVAEATRPEERTPAVWDPSEVAQAPPPSPEVLSRSELENTGPWEVTARSQAVSVVDTYSNLQTATSSGEVSESPRSETPAANTGVADVATAAA